MSGVDGSWEIVVRTPIGDQRATVAITSAGNGFSAVVSGAMGSLDVDGGVIEGDTLRWQMKTKVPMPMTLDCTATVEGDAMTGSVSAGGFGNFPMSGSRVS
ncbi:hypothetical protein Q5H94_04555 [Sphingomonas sp. CA1-15]|uniref:Uncharacterized protein n=1 Tax=Sphingomonas immobilis TaxID=3063997 RepID=A0ABT8ZVI2_9SPHN|nr:hypothetical protein [Sphingomonas sp. CA1-15]MDO7841585.1 hypothetical protein [Sphingomonas sp. CA1-15]